jgi:hypothetical protein
MDAYKSDLPSDFEDEEIDEDTAFNEEVTPPQSCFFLKMKKKENFTLFSD